MKKKTTPDSLDTRPPEGQRRGARYRLVGFLVLIILSLIAITSAVLISMYDRGTLDPQLNAAFYGLVLVCAILGFGLLYLLFTLPKALRGVQQPDAYRVIAPAVVEGTPEPVVTVPMKSQIDYGRESRDVEILEGIGTVFSRRLERKGIKTLQDLRAASGSQVADAAQVPLAVATRWKLMADLMLVSEVDAQAAELLIGCGVTTVRELASQNPEALARRARVVNQASRARIYPAPITIAAVETWIGAARQFSMPHGGTGDPGRTTGHAGRASA